MGAQIVNALTIVDTNILIDAALQIKATNLKRDTFRHLDSMAIPQSSEI
jgi:hypothetical protein